MYILCKFFAVSNILRFLHYSRNSLKLVLLKFVVLWYMYILYCQCQATARISHGRLLSADDRKQTTSSKQVMHVSTLMQSYRYMGQKKSRRPRWSQTSARQVPFIQGMHPPLLSGRSAQASEASRHLSHAPSNCTLRHKRGCGSMLIA